MKVLIIGSGAREHALVKALRSSPLVTEVHVWPGNEGISREAPCYTEVSSTEELMEEIRRQDIQLVIVVQEGLWSPLPQKFSLQNISWNSPKALAPFCKQSLPCRQRDHLL